MKYLVLTIVGMWFAFITVVQSFHALNALLIPNQFSPASMVIVGICSLLIGFGYTMFFVSLLDQRIPKKQTFTMLIVMAVVVTILFCFEYFIELAFHSIDLLKIYMQFDMFLRTRYHTVFAWMDFGNTLLLSATCLWWGLTGVVLLYLHQTRKKKV